MGSLIKKINGRDVFYILLGTFLMALSINLVYDPMGMVTGGVTGFAIAVKDLMFRAVGFSIPVWVSNIVINVPLFFVAYRMLGKKQLGNTLFATAMLTIFIYLIPIKALFSEDYLLAAVSGGVIGGVGIGFVLMTLSTTGGTDLLCMLIHQKKKYYSVPQLLIVVDSIVVMTGVLVFGLNRSLYAIISVYILAKVSDGILEGLKFAKLAYIISDSYQAIADEILNRMGRGVTGLPAKGMYSDSDKKLLFCVVSKKEIVEVLNIVNKLDPLAFVVIHDVREVVGEGFIEFKQ